MNEFDVAPRPAEAASSGSHNRRSGWTLVGLILVGLAVAAGASTIAVAASSSTRGSRARRMQRMERLVRAIRAETPVTSTVDPQIAAALPVFARAQQATDVPPSNIIGLALAREGANPSLARLAGNFSGQDVYLVPDNGSVCLASSELLAQGCYEKGDVLSGVAGETIACNPYMASDQEEQFGILPGASGLEATYSDGSVKPVQLSNGVFVLNASRSESPYPVALSWTDSSGAKQSEPTSITPDLPVPNPCSASAQSPLGGSPASQVAQAKDRIAEGLQ